MAYSPYLIEPPTPPVVAPGLLDVALGPLAFPHPAAVGYGVIYQPDSCAKDVSLVAMDCPPITGTKPFTGIETPVSGAPFVVTTTYQCSPVGMDMAEAERRVRLRMSLREQRAVETRVWSGSTGTLGSIPSLFANATVLTPASCPVMAISALEQWIADQGILGGLIHTRPGMMAHLSDHFELVSPNAQARIYRTHLGTPVVFGVGYAGTGPTGQAVTANTEWMYASGRVIVWRDDVRVPPPEMTFDRVNNVAYLIAERPYAVAIECGVAAIEVTRNCTT